MTGLAFILAQDGGFDFVYVVIVLLSMLGGLGKWIRDRSAQSAEGGEKEGDESGDAAEWQTVTPPHAARGDGPTAGVTPRETLTGFLQKAAGARQRAAAPQPQRRSVPPTAQHARQARPAQARSRQEELQAVEALIGQRSSQRKRPAPPPAPAVKAEEGFTDLTVAELRRAIVLNEILGPPVGLRGEHASR